MNSVPGRDERAWRWVVGLGGAIAAAAGGHTAVAGGRSFPPWRRHGPMVESELRYYSAFYAAYGVTLLAAAADDRLEPRRATALALPLLAGGVARGLAWRDTGPPHPLQRALLAIELAAPPLFVGWRALKTR
jgi:hypothetical protein